MFRETSKYQASTATLTPTRVLLGNSSMDTEWNFNQPFINESNPYINQFNAFGDSNFYQKLTFSQDIMPPRPQTNRFEYKMVGSYVEAPPTPTSPTSDSPPKKQRKKLLEKNREAAYRCRQKKKQWMHDLEQKSKSAEIKNKELQEQVSQLREESIYLRNLLLTHGNCDCDVVQAYLRRTSEQLSSNLPLMGPTPALVGSASSVSGSESSVSSKKRCYEAISSVGSVTGQHAFIFD